MVSGFLDIGLDQYLSNHQSVFVEAAHEHRASGFRVLGVVGRRARRPTHSGQSFFAAKDTEKASKSNKRLQILHTGQVQFILFCFSV